RSRAGLVPALCHRRHLRGGPAGAGRPVMAASSDLPARPGHRRADCRRAVLHPATRPGRRHRRLAHAPPRHGPAAQPDGARVVRRGPVPGRMGLQHTGGLKRAGRAGPLAQTAGERLCWRTTRRFSRRPTQPNQGTRMTTNPTNSIRAQVSPEEWQMRVDLAAAYRLVAMFGWDDLVFTHISAKIPGTEHFLINPYGSMFEEITASSLVKIDIQGNKVLESEGDVNTAGFTIHSCIHAARPDVVCVLHTHSINGVAVSAQEEGLLPLSQFAMSVLHSLAYHVYEGFALLEDEKPRLVRGLGDKQYMILRNHGLLTTGRSVAQAFVGMHRLEAACMAQVRALAGQVKLRTIAPQVLAMAEKQLEQVRLGRGPEGLVWPGLLRRLQRRYPGYDQQPPCRRA